MSYTELVQKKRSRILEIAENHGASEIRLFGSVGRGEGSQDSDIDFLVELSEGTSLIDVGQMLMELREELECDVDITTTGSLPPNVRSDILDESKAI